ncbi:hypothetical protein [Nocardia camponoti]|uniref:Uncharacterized protein n=1 Tax=Nocardia camponoti TaxID=1616106 RepID=A0A917VAU7_9NOCA|nr:hypothetical protein [Nocardia camponoti]GGK56511.1 hypothetical protein GCM10011591_30740 [Nocardia camponoti]
MSERPIPEVPNVETAVSKNRSGTVTVRATSMGLPIAIKFERGEYQFGAQALADEILRLTKRSQIAAAAKLRETYADAADIPDPLLDRLGLPTRREAVDELDRIDDADTGQTSWMRPL